MRPSLAFFSSVIEAPKPANVDGMQLPKKLPVSLCLTATPPSDSSADWKGYDHSKCARVDGLCIVWASITLHDSCRSDAVTRLFHHQRPAQDKRSPLSQSFSRAAENCTGTKGRGRFSADALCEAKLCYVASATGAFFAVSSLKAFNTGDCDASDSTLQPLKPRQYLCVRSHVTHLSHLRVSVEFQFTLQGQNVAFSVQEQRAC